MVSTSVDCGTSFRIFPIVNVIRLSGIHSFAKKFLARSITSGKSNRTPLTCSHPGNFILGDLAAVSTGERALFRPYLKTFVAPFLSTRLTAPGSPRTRKFKYARQKLTLSSPDVHDPYTPTPGVQGENVWLQTEQLQVIARS